MISLLIGSIETITELSAYRLIYFMVFIPAFITGLIVYKYHKALYILIGLLGLGILTELLVEVNKRISIMSEEFLYNLYIPLEYFLYAFFFYKVNSNRHIRKAILFSLLLFVVAILILSDYNERYIPTLSSDIYVMSGIFTVIWSVWTLFLIKPVIDMKFRKHPLFWICTALIVFYSASIPFNMMFNHLKSTNHVAYDILSIIIRKGLNIYLYLSIFIGFICSHRMKK